MNASVKTGAPKAGGKAETKPPKTGGGNTGGQNHYQPQEKTSQPGKFNKLRALLADEKTLKALETIDPMDLSPEVRKHLKVRRQKEKKKEEEKEK